MSEGLNRVVVPRQGQGACERTDWHNVVVWGKRGEALGKILKKGSTVFVEGSLRTSSYDDRDGNKRYKTEVIANNIILTGGRGAPSEAPDDSAPPERRESRGQGRSAPRNSPPPDESGGDGGDDDIPF